MRWTSFSARGKSAAQKKKKRVSAAAREEPEESTPGGDASWRASLGDGVSERYQIKQLIGAGSYSHVVEAYDTQTSELVAVKRIGRVFEDLIDCKRIIREIAILKRLDHDNVVRLRDVCLPEDLRAFDELNLVLEMCHSDLKQLFRTPVSLSMAVVKTLFYNTMVAMKYVHSAGIYHRDLKPANCLVNEDCSIKICDFGLARAVGSPPGSNMKVLRRQLTGHVVTRWYRAPELILLQSYYTDAIDVWSLGCIAAELFAMLKDNPQNPSRRKPLFRGSSCFPLSPEHEYGYHTEHESRDQLSIILSIIGKPSEEEISEIEGEEVRNYLRAFADQDPADFPEMFPGLPPEGVELLKGMLTFPQHQRIPVRAAVEHPFFADVRRLDKEKIYTDGPMFLMFEADGELDEKKLRRYALQEIQSFHPAVQIPDFDPPGDDV